MRKYLQQLLYCCCFINFCCPFKFLSKPFLIILYAPLVYISLLQTDKYLYNLWKGGRTMIKFIRVVLERLILKRKRTRFLLILIIMRTAIFLSTYYNIYKSSKVTKMIIRNDNIININNKTATTINT